MRDRHGPYPHGAYVLLSLGCEVQWPQQTSGHKDMIEPRSLINAVIPIALIMPSYHAFIRLISLHSVNAL